MATSQTNVTNTPEVKANVAVSREAQVDSTRHAAVVGIDELFAELGTSRDGLASEEEIKASRLNHGSNSFGNKKKRTLPVRLLSAFADPFTYILVFIAFVSVATDWLFAEANSRDITTPLIIGVMVLVSGILRFIQDERSTTAAAALAEMIETCASAIRGGQEIEVPLDDLVVGDIVLLASGKIVPADVRIIESKDLYVSQSSLTGESEPLEKIPNLPEGTDTSKMALSDLQTLAFMGSTIISGTARAVVVATGKRTMFGEATGTLAGRKRVTASGAGIKSVSKLLIILMACVLPLVFLISGFTKGNWIDALLFSLSVAVGLTPEMLPMLVTCCLAKGAVDLSHDQVIVKRLEAIQDLGGIDVLCTDKTGTLTEDAVVLNEHLDVNGETSADVLKFGYFNSKLSAGSKNLIDRAVINKGEESGVDQEVKTNGWQVIDELPFDFERRRLSVVAQNGKGENTLVCKGSIVEVMSVCSSYVEGGKTQTLDDASREKVMAKVSEIESKGMRVLGVAIKSDFDYKGSLSAADEAELTLIGFLAFLDPPKESARDAVAALAAHGVATKVLTGDSAEVAACTCGAIGIPNEYVLKGIEIETMSDEELALAVEKSCIFAKLSPSQKARCIAALHKNGHVVGYMGDGANDAAAMRESDCGISVDSAVDVAREAADIILLKKDLMVLEHGIECGRRTYMNMLKYVKMTVSSNFGNIFSILVAASLLPFIPMAAVQLLLLNLIYDLSCTAIPWDSVDDDMILKPCRWSTDSVRSFTLTFGPLSSIFDIATYAALFFWICPLVAGGSWSSLDAAHQLIFVGVFQAGWFIESMWTQTLVVHLIRTERRPFIESRGSTLLIGLGAIAVALSIIIPYSPLGGMLDFVAPAGQYWILFAVVIIGYVAATLIAKAIYIRKYGRLL